MVLKELGKLIMCAVLLASRCRAADISEPAPASLPSGGIYSMLRLHSHDNNSQDIWPSSDSGSNSTRRCFPLRQSRYCGDSFGDYYMSMLVTIGGRHVSSASELDSVMDAYFDSPDERRYINSFFGCQKWSGSPAPRFRIVYTCRSLLESHEAVTCNRHHKPPALCGSACDAYVDEWAVLTKNVSMCSNTTIAELRRTNLADSCSAWPYNGTEADGCISSTQSGAEICGFPIGQMSTESALVHDVHRVCDFCKSANDRCCRGSFVAGKCKKNSAQKHMVFYLALTISMGVVLLMLIAVAGVAAVWYIHSTCTSKKALLKDSNNNKNENNSSSISATASINNTDGGMAESRDTVRRTTSLVIDTAIKEYNSRITSPESPLHSTGSCQSVYPQPQHDDADDRAHTSKDSQIQSSQQQCHQTAKENDIPHILAYMRIGMKQFLETPLLKRIRKSALEPEDKQNTQSPRLAIATETSASNVNTIAIPCEQEPSDDSGDVDMQTKNESMDSCSAGTHRGIRIRNQSLRGHMKQPSVDEAASRPIIYETSDCNGPNHLKERIDDDVLSQTSMNEVFTVLYPYSSVEEDELSILPGESVCILRLFSDGWAFVQRKNDGSIGAIPVVCLDITSIEKDILL